MGWGFDGEVEGLLCPDLEGYLLPDLDTVETRYDLTVVKVKSVTLGHAFKVDVLYQKN